MIADTKNTLREDIALGAFLGLFGGFTVYLLITCGMSEFFTDWFTLGLILIGAPLSGIVGAMIGRQQRGITGGIIGAGVIGGMILLLGPPHMSGVGYASLEAAWLKNVLLGMAIGLVICLLVGGLSAAVIRLLRMGGHIASAAVGASIGAILPGYLFAFILAMIMHPAIRERLLGG